MDSKYIKKCRSDWRVALKIAQSMDSDHVCNHSILVEKPMFCKGETPCKHCAIVRHGFNRCQHNKGQYQRLKQSSSWGTRATAIEHIIHMLSVVLERQKKEEHDAKISRLSQLGR